MKKSQDVQSYIEQFPKETKARLKQIRKIILNSILGIQESMAYGMPGYKLYDRPLVYFAGYEHHIGLYATPSGHQAFKKELSSYKQGKGSVQFPNNLPLPFDLIQKIVEFRVKENTELYSESKNKSNKKNYNK